MEKMQQMRPNREDEEQFSPEVMREKMDAMMSEHDTAVKKILTDEQYEKYQKYMKENRRKVPGMEGREVREELIESRIYFDVDDAN